MASTEAERWTLRLLATLADEATWLTAERLAELQGVSSSATRRVLKDLAGARNVVRRAEGVGEVCGALVRCRVAGRGLEWQATELGAAAVAPELTDWESAAERLIEAVTSRLAGEDCPF